MCGIAGRILPSHGDVGADLVALMQAQSHRGADSTGFAVYGPPREDGYVVRAMGFDRNAIDRDIEDFRLALKEHGADFIGDPDCDSSRSDHYNLRVAVTDPASVADWIADADTMADRLEVQSLGRSLEIIKDEGDAAAVAEKHGVAGMKGTHGLGHARLATESDVLPNASHPFWARPFPDVAIVHNGQITDYFTWRKKLEYAGYRFLTDNDSELIAVWVSDQMNEGLTLDQALEHSIHSIDGVFTYMIANTDGIGFAKDKFAMKPLVVMNRDDEIAAATEEQAVRRIIPDEVEVINYDGPRQRGIWHVGNRPEAA